jgi:hypothetical protein
MQIRQTRKKNDPQRKRRSRASGCAEIRPTEHEGEGMTAG